ncbi:MBL fold metallo-hydrolase [Elongatibacter sediminis]|uniref:MBL fold metallo-hydrolase n=1 Tax=Elongatibacter sediminis TaxID=3119006 RepID=A0AAW9RF68_9GAMM
MNTNRFSAVLGIALLGVALSSLHAGESLPLQSVNRANEVIDAALEAHGGATRLAELNSLVQESRFITHATDQSRKPEPPWDRGAQQNFNAIDFERGVFVTRGTGTGGGFEFDFGTIIEGDTAWQIDYRAGTAAPIAEPDFNTASGPFIRVTPALLMKQLQARRQLSHWLGETDIGGRPHDIVTLVMEVGPGLSLYFDRETHMLTRMERVFPPFGQVEYRFGDYEVIDGIAFNRSFRLLVNGDSNIDSTITATEVNADVGSHTRVAQDLQRIPAVTPDDFNLQEIDEGVFLVGGTGTYGLFVEMADHVVAIGGTQGAAQRMAEVRKHVADKPVRYGVLTHHHSDHVPGAADYASEGATIITFREHEQVVRNVLDGAEARLEFVDERMTLTDGSRRVELYDIGPTPHAEHILIAYLPDEGIVFQADHLQQPRTGPLPPAVAATEAFAAALARLDLDYERIVNAHSPRISTADDLQSVLDRQPRKVAGAP